VSWVLCPLTHQDSGSWEPNRLVLTYQWSPTVGTGYEQEGGHDWLQTLKDPAQEVAFSSWGPYEEGSLLLLVPNSKCLQPPMHPLKHQGPSYLPYGGLLNGWT
jgi:hypothetical protein